MTEPRRWLDPASGASDELRSLMAVGAATPPRMPAHLRAELAARVAQLPPPVVAAPWWTRVALAVGGVSLVVGGAVATVRTHKPVAHTPAPHVAVARPSAPEAPRVAPVVPPPPPAPTPTEIAQVAARSEPRPAADVRDDDREERRLEEARRMLDRDPAATLAITHALARTHRHSAFDEERDYLAMRALVGMGRTDAARRAGERFLTRHPTGLYSAAVRRQMERLP